MKREKWIDWLRRGQRELDDMTNALTDCRVEKRRAPFDGPALPLPNGPALTRRRSQRHRQLPLTSTG